MAKRKQADPEIADVRFDPTALDALLGDRRSAAEIEALFRAMKKAVIERALQGELTQHLGYAPGAPKPGTQPNHRNGASAKTVLTDDGALPLAIPRDRAGSFEPLLVHKGVRRLPGFDAKVLSLYARGMTVREIQGHLEERYQVHVAPDLISTVTDAVLEEVVAWQQRPLEPVYAVVLFDCLRVKIRDEGLVRSKAVYLALGVDRHGRKDVLGLWIEQTEGATFWLRVLTELQSRGVRDILVALIDGLAGFPAAIATAFPQAQIHPCVVHLVRQSLAYVTWSDRQAVARALRPIYQAPTVDAATAALGAFAASPLGQRYRTIAPLWERHLAYVTPVFAYPPAIRRLLYTTNAIESLHMQLRKIIKVRGHFPNDEAAAKLLYLALTHIVAKWKQASREWHAAMPHFALLFGDRFMQDR